ncbi:hypothetical protein CONCODRAFT_12803 [Conidiobolus coronatus NRRL 28638]|uniref:Uncharacterized protein n=1 Tax=Conidiobolus coronatus (strain ATCC 28846 / CBS 209.66 / NRRL 28638) TaxID=796925 RepID=A0A137NS38_CONC2|nr:hypothetical protein CONCODRAFT_12803 [Conidiobolus coronatus NRRL 28638]|eukprot:KXN65571.1 hypothetical protein CONCODRAFT_12803 [Conidiobolus coronatus NRRL 28638]
MKLGVIIFVASAFALNQVTLHRLDGTNDSIYATPGDCKAIEGTPVINVTAEQGIVVEFYDNYGCNGNQVAVGKVNSFTQNGDLAATKSVKVVNESEPVPQKEPDYYHPRYSKFGKYQREGSNPSYYIPLREALTQGRYQHPRY